MKKGALRIALSVATISVRRVNVGVANEAAEDLCTLRQHSVFIERAALGLLVAETGETRD